MLPISNESRTIIKLNKKPTNQTNKQKQTKLADVLFTAAEEEDKPLTANHSNHS